MPVYSAKTPNPSPLFKEARSVSDLVKATSVIGDVTNDTAKLPSLTSPRVVALPSGISAMTAEKAMGAASAGNGISSWSQAAKSAAVIVRHI
ncbi:MAG: hypothetical protein IJR07_08420 [Bacteroidaceae bacterium]|nr:hypothetical protein [Bacteroidaceae bacterium]